MYRLRRGSVEEELSLPELEAPEEEVEAELLSTKVEVEPIESPVVKVETLELAELPKELVEAVEEPVEVPVDFAELDIELDVEVEDVELEAEAEAEGVELSTLVVFAEDDEAAAALDEAVEGVEVVVLPPAADADEVPAAGADEVPAAGAELGFGAAELFAGLCEVSCPAEFIPPPGCGMFQPSSSEQPNSQNIAAKAAALEAFFRVLETPEPREGTVVGSPDPRVAAGRLHLQVDCIYRRMPLRALSSKPREIRRRSPRFFGSQDSPNAKDADA